MNNEILKEQIEMAINNLNSTDEKEIKEINNLIEEINNEELKSELSILFTLKQLELSNQKENEVVSKPTINKSKKKLDVKVLIFAGTLGILSIAGGIKLVNRDNNKNISTSYSQSNSDEYNVYDYYKLIPYESSPIKNPSRYDTFDAKIYNPWSEKTGYYNIPGHLEDEGYFGPEGYEKKYKGTNEEFKKEFFVHSMDAVDYYSCPKNLIYDYAETNLEWVERYFSYKDIEVHDLHYDVTDEEKQAKQDEYNSKNPVEAAQLLNNNCDTYYNLYCLISNSLIKNDIDSKDYIISPIETWAWGKDEYLAMHLTKLLTIQKMYNKYLEVKVIPYMESHNCSLDEAKKAIKEEFKKGNIRDGSLIYISESQHQRFDDFLYTYFVMYIKDVGIDQVKEDYYFLFNEQYISENTKILTK